MKKKDKILIEKVDNKYDNFDLDEKEFLHKLYQEDPKEFESVDLGAVFLDEPPPENIFNACLSPFNISRVTRGVAIRPGSVQFTRMLCFK